MYHFRLTLSILVTLLLCFSNANASQRPNIAIILVDDMGYSDIGCYGGEIDTPHIDQLARTGVRFKQFYNSSRCCPTRASLLTGLHPHQAGIGHMTESPTRKSTGSGPYQGYLNRNCVTIAEVLREANYQTLMVGKWHLGYHGQDRWPTSRGFEKFYGIHAGAAHYFKPSGGRGLSLQDKPTEAVSTREGERYYMTDAFTDYARQFVTEAAQTPEKPFFLYLAYNAPHWPLHAKEKDIKKYLGRYSDGWLPVSAARLKKQQAMGLIDQNLIPAKHEGPDWESLPQDEKKLLDLKMASYAACVDSIDQNIGLLIETLKKSGQYENTILFFLTDNGACAEGGVLGRGKWDEFFDPEANTYGTLRYGRVWANVSSTPFRLYKHYTHEGGAATPLIVHWPKGIDQSKHNQLIEPYGYLPDFMPTCLELAGVDYPQTHNGRDIKPMQGHSLMPLIHGEVKTREKIIFFEHEGNGAARQGKWKIVRRGQNPWELYDMLLDRAEMNNLASVMPEKSDEMIKAWSDWATKIGVRTHPIKKKNASSKNKRNNNKKNKK